MDFVGPERPRLCFPQDRRIEELTLLLNQCRQFREVAHATRQGNQLQSFLSFLCGICFFLLATTSELNESHCTSFFSRDTYRCMCLGVIFPLLVTAAPPAVRSLSNGRTPSSSSEEEVHALMKNTDSASAKSEDMKSEVGTNDFSRARTVSFFA